MCDGAKISIIAAASTKPHRQNSLKCINVIGRWRHSGGWRPGEAEPRGRCRLRPAVPRLAARPRNRGPRRASPRRFLAAPPRASFSPRLAAPRLAPSGLPTATWRRRTTAAAAHAAQPGRAVTACGRLADACGAAGRQTREQLEGWLPREEWPHVNVLFVGLGQMVQQPAERAKLLRRCVDSATVSGGARRARAAAIRGGGRARGGCVDGSRRRKSGCGACRCCARRARALLGTTGGACSPCPAAT